ncbi:type 2 periplasmic-binding domain-containing protein [Paraburkholderia xenovorans]|uniref:hypothetical protein n=1 Tax=Paraburkholderia xenovorans TaxID=36873 RepID=UPI0038B86DB3
MPAFEQYLGLVTPPGHPLTNVQKRRRLRDCLDYPLIPMTPNTELRATVDRIDHSERARRNRWSQLVRFPWCAALSRTAPASNS